MILKATHITNLTDARYFAAKGVDYLGFNLDQSSESCVSPEVMHAIVEWVQGPVIVGDFAQTPLPVVRMLAEKYRLAGMQVALTPMEDVQMPEGMEVFLDLRNHSYDPDALHGLLAPIRSSFHYVVLDLHRVLANQAWNAFCAAYPVILHSDTCETVSPEALRATGAAGVSICGGAEDETGVKSFDETDDFIDALI